MDNRIVDFPGKKPKKVLPVRKTTMFLIENSQAEVLLEQRPPQGLWGGLWSFPEGERIADTLQQFSIDESKIQSKQKLAEFRHTFTHFHLDITAIHVKLAEMPLKIGEQPITWFAPSAPDEIGLTKPVTKLLKSLG